MKLFEVEAGAGSSAALLGGAELLGHVRCSLHWPYRPSLRSSLTAGGSDVRQLLPEPQRGRADDRTCSAIHSLLDLHGLRVLRLGLVHLRQKRSLYVDEQDPQLCFRGVERAQHEVDTCWSGCCPLTTCLPRPRSL